MFKLRVRGLGRAKDAETGAEKARIDHDEDHQEESQRPSVENRSTKVGTMRYSMKSGNVVAVARGDRCQNRGAGYFLT